MYSWNHGNRPLYRKIVLQEGRWPGWGALILIRRLCPVSLKTISFESHRNCFDHLSTCLGILSDLTSSPSSIVTVNPFCLRSEVLSRTVAVVVTVIAAPHDKDYTFCQCDANLRVNKDHRGFRLNGTFDVHEERRLPRILGSRWRIHMVPYLGADRDIRKDTGHKS